MSNQVVKRYSAVALFSSDLDRVVLIHKLRPAWQAGKANFPGGKVEKGDWDQRVWNEKMNRERLYIEETDRNAAHLAAAARELAEETGIVVAAESLTLFCALRFNSPDGEPAECRFYCGVGDVDAAQTRESESVFVADVDDVLDGQVIDCNAVTLPTMGNLPWLVAMARQRLRGDVEWRPGYVVEEVVS